MPGVHKMFWILNIMMWILFVYLKFSNPGFIATDVLAFEKASKMVIFILYWRCMLSYMFLTILLSIMQRMECVYYRIITVMSQTVEM